MENEIKKCCKDSVKLEDSTLETVAGGLSLGAAPFTGGTATENFPDDGISNGLNDEKFAPGEVADKVNPWKAIPRKELRKTVEKAEKAKRMKV